MFLPDVTNIRSPMILVPVVIPTSSLIEPRYSTLSDITASPAGGTTVAEAGAAHASSVTAARSAARSEVMWIPTKLGVRTCAGRACVPCARVKSPPPAGRKPRTRGASAGAARFGAGHRDRRHSERVHVHAEAEAHDHVRGRPLADQLVVVADLHVDLARERVDALVHVVREVPLVLEAGRDCDSARVLPVGVGLRPDRAVTAVRGLHEQVVDA